MAEDELGADRSQPRDHYLAKQPLHVEFLGVAHAAVGHHGARAGLKARFPGQVLGGVGLEPARLAQMIQRVRQRVASARDSTDGTIANKELERIVQYVAERQSRRERLAIKVGERFLLVQAEDIVYASLADEVITIVTSSIVGTSNYRTLDELHSHLDPAVFRRVHRSHVVNINKIKEIVPWFNRNYILRMKDGKSTEIPVSRAQSKRLREYLSL